MYLSILGVVLLCYISTEKYIHGSVDIYYILDILIGLSVFKKLIIIFSALPCETGFYDDWKHQYIKNIVIRTGRRNYIISKIVVCVSISFLVVFLGILIFIGLLIGMGFDYSGINGMGLDENMPYFYIKSHFYMYVVSSVFMQHQWQFG